MQHLSVLLPEAVDALVTDADGLYVDGTFGRGGHSRAILERLSPQGRLIAFDRDPAAIASAAADAAFAADPRFTIEHTAFSATPVGAAVNLEVDLVARYVERLLHARGDDA